ncbi:hypothetical protein [Carnobacterium maltaromaticum]|uniref:hypothetical protein n=1 Tax=Carnobacterium maltaromaticum TaxID=2751 RepID=UPI00191BAC9D|nr:hypothetical protein [Carnobacterium maltaromaticum]CAD5903083.1 hypothetical protein CMALT394_630005 [Carnobacterium maltaromaticum]
MKIEKYWSDATIYEINFIKEIAGKQESEYKYVYCSDELKKDNIVMKVDQLAKTYIEDGVCKGINEVYDALVSKDIEDSIKGEPQSFFQISFLAVPKNTEIRVDKILVLSSSSSHRKIEKKYLMNSKM